MSTSLAETILFFLRILLQRRIYFLWNALVIGADAVTFVYAT